MKIAIFHSFMDNIGGAEIVSLYLAEKLNADLYTTNIDKEKIKKMGFSNVIPRIKSIGRLPKNAPFRQQLSLLRFRFLNLKNNYDFYIISGDWAMSAVINNKPNMWYVHSPLNELWEFKDQIKKDIKNTFKKIVYDFWVYFNRKLTLKYSENINIWVCNSDNTRRRIKKYYNKEAEIIYPPIETKKYRNEIDSGYWLSVNRLVSHKRIEMQIRAFSKLPNERLIIVGSYEEKTRHFESYRKKIEKIKSDNIKILHWIDNKELIELYSKCKGFITTSINEDFGMSVVEAMASGKPVIAPNDGGYKESIINRKTGILIDNIDEDKIIETIKIINSNLESNREFYMDECIKQAEKFNTDIFIKKILDRISKERN